MFGKICNDPCWWKQHRTNERKLSPQHVRFVLPKKGRFCALTQVLSITSCRVCTFISVSIKTYLFYSHTILLLLGYRTGYLSYLSNGIFTIGDSDAMHCSWAGVYVAVPTFHSASSTTRHCNATGPSADADTDRVSREQNRPKTEPF